MSIMMAWISTALMLLGFLVVVAWCLLAVLGMLMSHDPDA